MDRIGLYRESSTYQAHSFAHDGDETLIRDGDGRGEEEKCHEDVGEGDGSNDQSGCYEGHDALGGMMVGSDRGMDGIESKY